jgi:hypothetical protein
MMTLDSEGNFEPWVQPNYGYDASDTAVVAPLGYTILERNVKILPGDIPFDVYSGWIVPEASEQPYNSWHSRQGHHTSSVGRWTTWARPNNSEGVKA